MTTRTVHIPSFVHHGREVSACDVQVNAEGVVVWERRQIGVVWKGTRDYSPPTHRGSRIARYHKQVPEWHGHPHAKQSIPWHRADTRQRVIQLLIADAIMAGVDRPKPEGAPR